MSHLDKLLDISSPPILAYPPDPPPGTVPAELSALLRRRNGFYAFEGALHVFHLDDPGRGRTELPDLLRWNDPALWKHAYPEPPPGLCFAEDAFGGQYVLQDGAILKFDPETEETEKVGKSLEDWARAILADWRVETGHPLACAWMQRHGPLRPGQRLLPVRLFMLGGAFDAGNLKATDAVEAMIVRGGYAWALQNIRDGERVQFVVESGAA